MKTVHVNASKNYDIIIGANAIDYASKFISDVCPSIKKCAVITDDNVDKLWSAKLEKNLSTSGYDVVKYAFPNGESSKSMQTLTNILNFLSENEITRSDAVIALGGGVVGDTAGFAAAVFLRGIRFIQIPTTLLAMTDSSVGGKTAINLDTGKNLAGVFWQPDLVICDTLALSTLSEKDFSDGCAEIIKYGVIADKELFEFICANPIEKNAEFTIERCVSIKADIVSADERDTGIRQLLNFGHTIGHAVEKRSDYKISHGSAVAIGMALISKGAYKSGLCGEDLSPYIITALKKYRLPTQCPFSAKELFDVVLSDKKRSGDFINLVIPEEIGRCVLKKIPAKATLEIIEKGLSL